MDKLPCNELDRKRAHTRRVANEMGKLFISCPNAEQTDEYEAWRMQYMQSMTEERTLRV